MYNGGSTIGAGGWTVTGSDVLVLNNTYFEPHITFNSHTGDNALDITGAGNTGPADGVMQDVATAIGQSYTLSFFVGRGDDTGGSGNYPNASSIGLNIGGGLFTNTFTNSDVTLNMVNWKGFSVNFTATSVTTNIAFTNATPLGNNYAGLDDVSLSDVQSVPEPAAFAMAAVGLLPFLGAALRRARARRSA